MPHITWFKNPRIRILFISLLMTLSMVQTVYAAGGEEGSHGSPAPIVWIGLAIVVSIFLYVGFLTIKKDKDHEWFHQAEAFVDRAEAPILIVFMFAGFGAWVFANEWFIDFQYNYEGFTLHTLLQFFFVMMIQVAKGELEKIRDGKLEGVDLSQISAKQIMIRMATLTVGGIIIPVVVGGLFVSSVLGMSFFVAFCFTATDVAFSRVAGRFYGIGALGLLYMIVSSIGDDAVTLFNLVVAGIILAGLPPMMTIILAVIAILAIYILNKVEKHLNKDATVRRNTWAATIIPFINWGLLTYVFMSLHINETFAATIAFFIASGYTKRLWRWVMLLMTPVALAGFSFVTTTEFRVWRADIFSVDDLMLAFALLNLMFSLKFLAYFPQLAYFKLKGDDSMTWYQVVATSLSVGIGYKFAALAALTLASLELIDSHEAGLVLLMATMSFFYGMVIMGVNWILFHATGLYKMWTELPDSVQLGTALTTAFIGVFAGLYGDTAFQDSGNIILSASLVSAGVVMLSLIVWYERFTYRILKNTHNLVLGVLVDTLVVLMLTPALLAIDITAVATFVICAVIWVFLVSTTFLIYQKNPKTHGLITRGLIKTPIIWTIFGIWGYISIQIAVWFNGLGVAGLIAFTIGLIVLSALYWSPNNQQKNGK